MSKELAKKAVEMLLNGAALVSDPCPYCKGVRIIKDGNALCVNCGKEVRDENSDSVKRVVIKEIESTSMSKLDEKLKELTEELRTEKDYEKQQQILRSINEIIVIKEKLRNL